jgi:hypothetical protein
MRHGDPIGIGILRQLGHLLLRPYSQYIYVVEKESKSEGYEFHTCSFHMISYNLDMLFSYQSVRNRITKL